MWREWIAVAAGGMVGSVARHGLNWVFYQLGPSWLPVATLTANCVGCFVIGWLFQWSINLQNSDYWWVIGLRVGVLGGLTTFSTFGLEVVRAWQVERTGLAIALVIAHVVLGLAAVVIGMNSAGPLRQ